MAEGQKRLEPRMTRGGFRFQLVMVGLLIVISVSLFVVRSDGPWDAFHLLLIGILILNVAFLGYLLFYVRRRDGHFWDEEEARRADWDRRGRQL